MRIPIRPYIGLYGSHSGDWRRSCERALKELGIAFYDPTDVRWKSISEATGDRQQSIIDRLVAKQHRGMLRAMCVIHHLAAHVRYADPANRPKPDDTGREIPAFAARAELGYLMGRGIRTFSHIEPDVAGRNYFWAAMKDYPHVTRVHTLDEAVELAAAYFFEAGTATRIT